MLRIRAVRIEIHTPDHEFEANFAFEAGLNVIKGENTSGKSTVFQAILYALGMEELLGGRNASTMQSALRDSVDFPKGVSHDVLESRVFLEIENSEVVTLERGVKAARSQKLVRVHRGSLLTGSLGEADFQDFWLHDKGGAQNESYGFHRFLETFLGWNLPAVTSTQGDPTKLYIQTVFPAFVVEQKAGWTDFLATVPYYSIRDAATHAIEFILGLDVFDNARRRQEINFEREQITNAWTQIITVFERLRNEFSILIGGVPQEPEIFTSEKPISVQIQTGESAEPLPLHIENLRRQAVQLEATPVPTVGQQLERLNSEIDEKTQYLDRLTIEYEILGQSISLKKEREQQYRRQLATIKIELQHNRDVQKIYELGGEAKLSLAEHHCPTCSQPVEDTLYIQDLKLAPMTIAENIRYVEAQEKMLTTYLENEQRSITLDEVQLKALSKSLEQLRQDIRSLKGELVTGEHTLSYVEVERRIRLRKVVDDYVEILDRITSLLSELFELSDRWRSVLSKEKRLPSGDLTAEDFDKVRYAEEAFRDCLRQFGYSSKSEADVSISRLRDRKFLLPIAERGNYSYNIRFDSSGSDLIRAIWAYYCGLFETGVRYQTNHPQLLMFDEPIQQDVSDSSVNQFFRRLASYDTGQVLVFAAFGESEQVYADVMSGLSRYHLIEVTDRTLQPRH